MKTKQQKNMVTGLVIIGIVLAVIILLLMLCPWINEDFVESKLNSNTHRNPLWNNSQVYYQVWIPFGKASIICYEAPGRVNGIVEIRYHMDYTTCFGMNMGITHNELEKLKPNTAIKLEQKIIDAIKEKYPEVSSINNTASPFDGQGISGEVGGNGSYTIVFYQGWGDCPSGCMSEHWWYFSVNWNGEISLTHEIGDPFPFN